jgi:hypothetical protein
MITNKLEEFLADRTIACYTQINLPPSRLTIFAGSFNPLHECHLAMFNEVNTKKPTGAPLCIFEICIDRFDKPPMDEKTILKIEQQFLDLCRPYVFTRARSYLRKLQVFPNSDFIVGADTLDRILDKKYCFDSEIEHKRIIQELKLCNFYVAERGILTRDKFNTNMKLIWLDTKMDISSSELRKRWTPPKTVLVGQMVKAFSDEMVQTPLN